MLIPFTDALRQEYTNLFKTCQLAVLSNLPSLDLLIDQIVDNQARYQNVADPLSIPWYFVGIVHHMESNLKFDRHLHNGDPLSARTVHEPKGRPATGSPPFTWEQSATDALKDKSSGDTDWTMPGFLYNLEAYNGFGYRLNHPEVLSPYLWSMSNHYTKGKYVSDGVFDPDAVSTQQGGALVLRRMAERNIVEFQPPSDDPSSPTATADDLIALADSVSFSSNTVSPAAKALQLALNQFPGIFLLADGIAGARTANAFNAVTGENLQGDPRAEGVAISA